MLFCNNKGCEEVINFFSFQNNTRKIEITLIKPGKLTEDLNAKVLSIIPKKFSLS